MKAISLWQPWASAIAVGAKHVETRSWPTAHRGTLAIHAAKRCIFDELCHFASSWSWTGALWPLKWGMHPEQSKEERDAPLASKLPFGAIVAVCELAACRRTDDFTQGELDKRRLPDKESAPHLYAWTERMMGDFTPGRYGWVLVNIRMLPTPIPCRGAQGLFNLPDNVLRQVQEALCAKPR